jgi:AAA domain
MSSPILTSQAMDRLDEAGPAPADPWLWDGCVARGRLTLLTSLWKAGKTTLLTGLLQRLGRGEPFLGRACEPARALVVSEEPQDLWAGRLRAMPVGPHARPMSRPFRGRPSPAGWQALVDHAASLRASGQLDLLVVDPLASFLPGRSESDPGTLLEMLHPLQWLAAAGAGVIVLHHPRRAASDEGSAARGSGALLGLVDIILELHRAGRLASDRCRRRLVGLSRHLRTPERLDYEWDPATGAFRELGDPLVQRFRDNWPHVRGILQKRRGTATHHELLADWPADLEKPPASLLYEWLNRATEEKLVRRPGKGTRDDPYRYRLPNADDEYYDRGELPPIRLDDDWRPLREPD